MLPRQTRAEERQDRSLRYSMRADADMDEKNLKTSIRHPRLITAQGKGSPTRQSFDVLVKVPFSGL